MAEPNVRTLHQFLDCVRLVRWRKPPKVWNEIYREALSERYVKVGFGGVLELTEAGSSFLKGE